MKIEVDWMMFWGSKLLLLQQNTFKPNEYVPTIFAKNILLNRSTKAK
jgi:hypothetical protein